MPEYRHPRADADAPGHPPAQVHVSRGERAPVTDGTFEAPQSVAESIARQHDTTAAEMRVGGDSDDESGETETCDAVKADGDVCGRDLPCRFHSD